MTLLCVRCGTNASDTRRSLFTFWSRHFQLSNNAFSESRQSKMFFCSKTISTAKTRLAGNHTGAKFSGENVFLPQHWGFVPQHVVIEKLVPDALWREVSFGYPLIPLWFLGYRKHDILDGATQAYRFVAEKFIPGQAIYASKWNEQVKTNLGIKFDDQLRHFESLKTNSNTSLVEVHDVHDVVLTSCFPLSIYEEYWMQGPNPGNDGFEFVKSMLQFKSLESYRACASHFFRNLISLSKYSKENGQFLLKLSAMPTAVEVVIRTTETVYFGPESGKKNDCKHVLWFHNEGNRDDSSFRLANMNEVLTLRKQELSFNPAT